jgi:predicted  nucleic acid-binding Zn-ribbon protein
MGMVIKAVVNGPEEIKRLELDLVDLGEAVKYKRQEKEEKRAESQLLAPSVEKAKAQMMKSKEAVTAAMNEVTKLSDRISEVTGNIGEAHKRQSVAEEKCQDSSSPTDTNVVHPDPIQLREDLEKITQEVNALVKKRNQLEAELEEKEKMHAGAKRKSEEDEREYGNKRSALELVNETFHRLEKVRSGTFQPVPWG